MPRRDPEVYLVLFTLWLGVFSLASQVMIIAPILPRIGEQLGVDQSLLGTLITSYALMVAAFSLITGPVSDHVGRRRILLVGAGVMTVALLLHGLVQTFASLLAVRAFAGIAGGMLNGAAVAYVGDYFPREQRGWANGWVLSGLAAGQIAGIPLGTILADAFGFRGPFLAFAVPMVITFLLVWIRLPQPAVEIAQDRLTVRSAVDEYTLLLRRPEIAAATGMFLFVFLGISIYIAYLPTWLATTLGATGTAIAGMFFVGGIANVIAGPQAGRLSDRIGRKRVIVWASVGITLVMLVTPFVVRTLWIVYPLFFLVMGLMAARLSPLQALLSELVSSRERGSLMNLTIGIGQIGFGLGGAVAGLVYSGLGYTGNAVLAAGSMFIVAGLAWRYLVDTEPTAAPPQAATERTLRNRITAFGVHHSQGALCGPLHEAGQWIDRAPVEADTQRSSEND